MKYFRLLFIIIVVVLVTILSSPSARSGQARAAQEGEASHKVIASPPLSKIPLEGVELLHNYGSYALYDVVGGALTRLQNGGRVRIQIVDDMDLLRIDAYPFNTQTDPLAFPEDLRFNEFQGQALHLVQFVGPIKAEWLDAVEAAGAIPIHYIANNGYLMWADAPARDALAALVQEGDFLQFSAPYHPYFKFGPAVQDRIRKGRELDLTIPVFIQIYDHPAANTTKEMIARLATEQLSPWESILTYQNVVVRMRVGDLKTVARQPDVFWMNQWFPRERMDEVQGQILAARFDGSMSGPSGPGYLPWLNGLGFSSNPADYPIVDVTDDGIGDGTLDAGDNTLHELGLSGNPTRVMALADCTADGDPHGLDGHGHINASIVGGYDTRTGFPYEDGDGFQRGLGINPYTRLAGTRIFADSGSYDVSNCGGTDQGVILQNWNNGARISSNSWGCSGCAGSYDGSSQAYDAGTRDADPGTAGNQELTFIFSAGNSGYNPGTVGTPGNGKNMITVGASENDRPTWIDGCNIGLAGADDAMDVIDFSSRGPAPGNRVKPEVIAPGTHIQGTASTDPGYTGNSVCDQYHPGAQTIFAASSGTSHSAPAVAGVSSLAYWWLENTYGITPSPAMMKAYLIAHPTYLTGAGANDTLPSNSQGYGMPNMAAMFDDTGRRLVDQTSSFDNSGETWTWAGAVADPARPVRIVLAYTDAPGAIGTSPEVNDLNLEATVDGNSYLGNVFSGQWSVTGGAADADNNYEAIFLPAGTSGNIDITITAFNIAGDGVPGVGDGADQDFALVCYNCTDESDFALTSAPNNQDVCVPNDAIFEIPVGQILGFSAPVTLSASGNPAGTTTSFSPNGQAPPYTSTLTIGNTGAAMTGTYPIDVVGVSPTRTHTTTVQLNLYDTAPSAPTAITPADGSTGVSTTPTFTWSAVSGTAGYDIDVATDLAFTNIVASATGLTGASYTPGSALSSDTVYYWRVQANNPCGSDTSAIAAFRTVSIPPAVCSTPGVSIPDNDPAGVDDVMTVTDSGTLSDLDASVLSIHGWVGDLSFTLTHDDTGASVTIIDQPGVPASTYGCSGDDIDATLDDEATDPVENECAASTPTIQGDFVPQNLLSAFDGEDLSGSWTLNAADLVGAFTGTLDEWCLLPTVPLPDADYGDLASSYGAAWHEGSGAPRLGSAWDADTAFTQNSDDASDDGVVYASGRFVGNDTVTFDVTASAAGYLAGWFDWNDNGRFESGEQMFDQPVVSGAQSVSMVVPAGFDPAADPVVDARFRLYDADPGAATPDGGYANDGEVEDYRYALSPTAVGLRGVAATARVAWWPAVMALALLVAGGVIAWRRRERA